MSEEFELVTFFKDSNGKSYSSDVPYYQPVQPANAEDELFMDKDGDYWPGHAVWRTKEECASLFPGNVIQELHGDDIKAPMFVDRLREERG